MCFASESNRAAVSQMNLLNVQYSFNDSMEEETTYSSNSTFDIPTYLTSDYIEIVYLILTFIVGTPLNLYTFVKLFHQYYVTKSRILLLSLHLNTSDLMILFFFAFPKVCWLFTYQWLGGDFLCRLVKFAQVLSFSLSSNIIVCIGLDRLMSLLEPLQIRATASWKCKRMLTVAWVLALIISAPQIHVWTVFEPVPEWAQCVDIWIVWSYQNITSPEAETFKTAYKISHIIFIFWLPLTIVLFCYVVILKIVYNNMGDGQRIQIIRTRSSSSNNRRSSNSSGKRKTSVTEEHNPIIASLRYHSLNNRQNQYHHDRPTLRRNVDPLRVRRTKYHTLKITLLIVLAYIVFWLPYNILAVWSMADSAGYLEYVEKYLYFFYNLIAVNAVINPLIYSRFSFFLCTKKTQRTRANVRFMKT